MVDKFHLDVLPEEQLGLFEALSAQTFISKFYLAGGTCLALQIGHRRSIDMEKNPFKFGSIGDGPYLTASPVPRIRVLPYYLYNRYFIGTTLIMK